MDKPPSDVLLKKNKKTHTNHTARCAIICRHAWGVEGHAIACRMTWASGVVQTAVLNSVAVGKFPARANVGECGGWWSEFFYFTAVFASQLFLCKGQFLSHILSSGPSCSRFGTDESFLLGDGRTIPSFYSVCKRILTTAFLHCQLCCGSGLWKT